MPNLRMISVQTYPHRNDVDIGSRYQREGSVFFLVRIHMDEPPFRRESRKLYDWDVAQHLKRACRLRQAELEAAWFDEAQFDHLMEGMENACEESVSQVHYLKREAEAREESAAQAGPDE